MSKFLLRNTTRGDWEELNALYYLHTGIKRTYEQFSWEWFDGPYGPAPSWVVVDQDNRRIAAHHGVIPCPFWYKGNVIKGARTENSMVDPSYRGKVLYVSYEAKLLKTLLKDFDLIFTTTGKGTPGIIRKRLGYRSIGHWRTFTLHEPIGYLATRIAGNVVGRIFSTLTPTQDRRQGDFYLERTEDIARVVALWKASRITYIFSPDREAAYLKWRLLDNPFQRSNLCIITKKGKDFGFIAWSERQVSLKAKDVIIDDIFCLNNDIHSYHAALSTFKNSLEFMSARITLRTLMSDNALCGVASLNIPRRLKNNQTKNGAELLVRTQTEVNFKNSTLTMLISEGIN